MNQSTVSWDAPENAKASLVTYYYVQVLPEDRVVKVDADTLSTVITGLKNGVPVDVVVYAASELGRSKASDSVTVTPTSGMEGEVAGLIVKFEAGADLVTGSTDVPGADRVDEVALTAERELTEDARLVALSEPVTLEQAEQIAADLTADPKVEWAEPDQFVFASSTDVPDDPQYASGQWNLWSDYGIGIGDGPSTMSADRNNTGTGVTVAVIDTGITEHPDLAGQLVDGYDFVSDPEQLAAAREPGGSPVPFDADGESGWDANPTDPGDWRGVAPVRDSTWHGTRIAGLIAAKTNNAEGIVGIAPGAKVQPIRALSWRGGLLSDIIAAITWASGGTVDGVSPNANPAKVINMSFAAEATCSVAMQQAITNARERGSVLIAAAGNANDDASKYTPGNCNDVITVAATGRDGKRAPYSNYGTAISIAAPGGRLDGDAIITTSNTGRTTTDQPGYQSSEGTSIAAAHVSAAAALLFAADPAAKPADITARLGASDNLKAFANNACDADPTKACGPGILDLAQVQGTCSTSTSTSGSFTVVRFTSTGSCDWTVPTGVTQVEYLVVAGGGGGGAWVGGGGGGGGVLSGTSAVTPGDSLPVVVGAGGSGTSSNGGTLISAGTNGQDSRFMTVRALGGGRGAAYEISAASPTSGGSGGGGSSGPAEPPTWQRGQMGVPGQGSNGGDGRWENNFAGGGGGGAGGAGSTASQVSAAAGAGGPGRSSSITGTTAFYGGGGGGGVYSASGSAGSAGTGGGGAGGRDGNGSSGTANTGGGGGGAASGGPSAGGSGGSGIVIVRYATTTTTCTSSTTTSGVYTIVQFTGTAGCTSSWTVPTGVTLAEYLVQAGGGGGGGVWNASGGGGGAGGLVSTEGRPVAVTPGASMPVLVGAGGAGGTVMGFTGGSGGDSALGTTVADGGGGGAGGVGDVSGFAIAMSTGGSGGSGGGGVTYNTTAGTAGSGIFGQGHAGGSFAGTAGRTYGSGGGGAGGPGVPSYFESETQRIGAGGPARYSAFTGTLTAYGAGGAGRSRGVDAGSGTNASNNTGAGGGGAAGSSTANGGTGGSGIVLVRYRTPPTAACPAPTKVGSVWRMTATTDCLWTVPSRLTSADVVVVGGGGGGGGTGSAGGSGGGGGAGGVVTLTGTSVTPAAVVPIFVGSGGVGGNSTTLAGGQGVYSAFGNTVANGGGGGGGGDGDRVAAGMSGGSGGGSTAFNEFTGVAGAGTSGQGNAGGNATGVRSYTYASGGGGAGSAGAAAVSSATGAVSAGGTGVLSAVTGTTVGVGGAGLNRVGTSTNGTSGTAATGNGGSAGASNGGYTAVGGAGGSGVVAITYTRACAPTSSIVGSYTVLTIDDPGGCDWSVPSGLNSAEYVLVGGGGGGGLGGQALAGRGGGGGGGGVVTTGTASLTGASVPVSVGTGGALETAGGTTSFGAISAAGGGAGSAGAADASSGGSGGSSGSRTGSSGGGSAGGQGASSSANGTGLVKSVLPGTVSAITGTSVSYGDGGGGGWGQTSGAGERGTGPGAGGGGGEANSAVTSAASGRVGTVMIRYQTVRAIAVTTAPVAAASGGLLATQPVVELRDLAGARVTTDSFTTVTVSTSTSGARVAGSTTVTASSGVATFTNLRVFGAVNTPITLTFTTNSPEARTTTASVTPQSVSCPTSARSFAGGRTIWAMTDLGACSWTAPSTLVTDVSYLVVGGGGGGGLGGQALAGRGGGGGGGGVVAAGTTTIAPGATSTVDVGDGGTVGVVGETSAFGAISAAGGGAGSAGAADASSGGSGGSSGSRTGSSGGGSAGGQGASSSANGTGLVKSVLPGTVSAITGTSVSYGDGGGGGWGQTSGAGERGTGPGAGGGGGEANSVATSAASGRAGTVIIRHQTVQSLAFTTTPVGGQVGAALGTQPVLELLDGSGARVTSDSSTTVTVTVSSGPLTGTTTATASSGVVTFTDLALGTAVGSYTLTFTTAGLPDAQVSTSTAVMRTHGPAAKLVFTTQPSATTVAGVAFAAQPVVQIQDEHGNVVNTGADATRSIELTPTSGTLVGTRTLTASAGVASFNGLLMNTTAVGRKLTAKANVTSGTISVDSSAFAITVGSPSAFAVTVSSTSPVVMTDVTATAQLVDQYGNDVQTTGTVVTWSKDTAAGALTVNSTTDASGRATATFTTGTTAGVATILTAEAGAVAGSSLAITTKAGAAAKLVVSSIAQQTAGTAFPVTVMLTDQYGNLVDNTGAIGTVTLSRETGTGALGGTVSEDLPVGQSTVTLPGVTYTKAESGVVLTATGSTKSGESGTSLAAGKVGNSNAFTVVPGVASAATSTIVATPTAIKADGFSHASITVQLKDVAGNALTTGGASVTISSTSGTVGTVFDNNDGTYTASLTSTLTPATATVSATVGNTSLSATATVTFKASTPHDITVTAGNAQSATVGTAVANAVKVRVVDVSGNPIDNATVSFAATPGSGSLAAASATTDADGEATMPAWTLGTTAGVNAVTASVTGGITTTITATGTVGSVTGFAVTLSGGDTALSTQSMTAGIATPVRVTAVDQYGNANSSWSGAVTLTSTAMADGVTVPVTISSGGFADGVSFTPTVAASGRTISASATSITSAVASSTFTVKPGAVASFRVTQSGGSTALADVTAGTPFNVRVTALDEYGNVQTGWTGVVTLQSAAWSGSVSATISGNGYVDPVAITPQVAGSGFVVRASSGPVVTNAASGTVAVSAGSPHELRIVTAASSQVSGELLAPQPVVEITDQYGNRTSSTDSVTVAVSGGTTPGTLSGGATTVAAVSGLATFTDLAFSGVVDETYTLTFTSGSLAQATSTISPSTAGNAAGLRFSVQPASSIAAGTSFGVTVRIVDAAGNTVTSGDDATRAVTVTSTSGALACAGGGASCLTETASSGLATFTNLRMTSAATGRQLRAAATIAAGAVSVKSTPFAITGGTATQLVLTATGLTSGSPDTLVSGASATFTATVRDQFGNVGATDTPVVFAQGGADVGSVAGLTTVNAVQGVATLSVPGARAGAVSITAAAAGLSLTSAPSTFTVTPGAVASADLVVSSGNLAGDTDRTVTVTLRDVFGNVVTNASNQVSLVNGGSGSVTGIASPVTPVNGVATFTVGGGTVGSVSLQASVAGTSITSETRAFTVVPGSAAQLVLDAAVTDLAADGHRVFTATVMDGAGNVVTDASNPVTFAQTVGSGEVTGLGAVSPVDGVASLTIDGKLVGPVTITASMPGPIVSNALSLTVVAGDVDSILLSGEVTDLESGATRTLTATLRDIHGNTVTSSSANVTFTQYLGGGSVTVGGNALPTTVAAQAGVATLTVTGAAAGLVEIDATATIGGIDITSNDRDFTVVHGTASRVLLTGSSSPLTAGDPRTFTATVVDANGNTVSTGAAASSVVVFAQDGSDVGSVTGLGSVTASSGVASTALTGARVGSVTLTASVAGLTPSTSVDFDVATGAAHGLALTTQPSGAVHGSTLTTQPVVQVVDVAGNAVESSGVVVTASIASGTGTLTNATATSDSDGIATFSGLTIAGTSGPLTLSFSAPALASVTSSSFTLAKATQTVSFGALSNATYGDPAFTVSATASSLLQVMFSSVTPLACEVSGTAGRIVSIVGVGTCIITASQAGDGSYQAASTPQSFTISQANQAPVSIDTAGPLRVGQAVPLIVSGGSGSGALTTSLTSGPCQLTSGTLTATGVGTCVVTGSRAADTRYRASTTQTASITVNRADQVLAFTSVVPQTPVVGGTYTPVVSSTSSVTGSSTGLAATIAITSGSPSVCTMNGAGVVTFAGPGSCELTATQAGDANVSAATSVTQTIVVGLQNQSITFAQPANRNLGSGSLLLEATSTSDLPLTYTVASASWGVCSVTALGAVSLDDAGVCEITASQAGNAQVAAATPVTRTFTITPVVPTMPHVTSVTSGDQSVTVAFSPPGDDGGSAITGYEITATPIGGGTTISTSACLPTAGSCTLFGLDNDTDYTVEIAAINPVGIGPAIEVGVTVDPAPAPFAVTDLTTTRNGGAANLAWAPITVTAPETFTRYEIGYRVAGTSGPFTPCAMDGTTGLPLAPCTGTDDLRLVTADAVAVGGLSAGLDYEFEVTALTSEHPTTTSPENAAVTTGFQLDEPSAPRNLQVLGVDPTTVQFSWSTPNVGGGSAPANPPYVISVTSITPGAASPITCVVVGRHCNATGLTNGAAYTFGIYALNGVGPGPTTTTTYSIPSVDATLSGLAISSGVLSPAFATATTAYTASVDHAVSSVTVTPTVSQANATVTVRGSAVASGNASGPISLNVGETRIAIVVTAADPTRVTTYTITVTRAEAPSPPPPAPAADPTNVVVTPGGQMSAPVDQKAPAANAIVLIGGVPAQDITTKPLMSDPVAGAQPVGLQISGAGFGLQVVTKDEDRRPVGLTPSESLSAPVGGWIDVTVTGYAPGTSVDAQLVPVAPTSRTGVVQGRAGASIRLGQARVAANGDVTHAFAIPDWVRVGEYALRIDGTSASRQALSVSVGIDLFDRVKPTAIRACSFAPDSALVTPTCEKALRAAVRAMAPVKVSRLSAAVTAVAYGQDSAKENRALARARAAAIGEVLDDLGVSAKRTVGTVTRRGLEPGYTAAPVPVLVSSEGLPATTVVLTVIPPSGSR